MDTKINNVIVICDVGTANGGAANVAIQSAIGLSKMGLNVILFSSVGPVDKKLQDAGVKVVCLYQKDVLSESNRIKAMFQGIWNVNAYEKFNKLLSEFNPNDTIIHSHVLIKALSSSIWAVIAKYNYRVFVTLHDYFLFCPNGGLYNYRKSRICELKASSFKCYYTNCDSRKYSHKVWRDIRQIVQKTMFSRISKLYFISISSLNKQICYPYLSKYASGWYELQNPIELNQTSPVQIENNNSYLFMGRLSPEKGLDLFCEAISKLKLNGIVLGDGELKEKYELQYPNIKFVGWVVGEEKIKYIKQCKALVFPSRWYEGAPLTIVELKSYGIPCIVPDKCAASEEIEDKITGLIFKTGDLDSLIGAMDQYEKMDISVMQKNILNSFDASSYSLENHCKKLCELYNHV